MIAEKIPYSLLSMQWAVRNLLSATCPTGGDAYFKRSELCKVAILRPFLTTLAVIGHFVGPRASNIGVGMPHHSVVYFSNMRCRSLFILALNVHTLPMCMALAFQRKQRWVPDWQVGTELCFVHAPQPANEFHGVRHTHTGYIH